MKRHKERGNMKYTTLGTTDIRISQICFGCMSFGNDTNSEDTWTLNYEESEALVKKALDSGINFFDTANIYANGMSETYLGRALKKLTTRDKVVIATKVYFNDGKLSKEAILREVDQSLARLQTDYIDLYIIHRFDTETPIEETMEALDSLVKSGKVRALGASAMYGFQFNKMQAVAEKNGWTKFVSMQNHYNLIYREDEREMIPICKDEGVSLTPYSPLAAGRLARLEWQASTKRSEFDKTAKMKYDSTQEADYRIVERVAELAAKYGVTLSQISLAWLLAKGVASPIIGTTKAKYIDEAAGAVDVQLSEEDITYLEELYVPHKIVGALPVR